MPTDTRETLTVTGVGSAAAAPDRALIALVIEAHGVRPSDAYASCRAATATTLEALRQSRVGVQQLHTTNIDLSNEWNAQSDQQYYVARHRVEAQTLPALIGEVIDAAFDAAGDAFRLDHVQMSHHDTADLQQRALEAAFEDAQRQANALAHAAYRELAEVITVTALDGDGGGEGLRAFSAAATQVAVGELSLTSRVRVTWRLVDPTT